MNEINIRQANKSDYRGLAKIWLQASIVAHDFIAEKYWHLNQEAMETDYLPQSTVYIAEGVKTAYGFVALLDTHIAAIFVKPEYQGRGIGRLLIKHVMKSHKKLSLNVFQKNFKSIEFYQKLGFVVTDESIDDKVNESEFIMYWFEELNTPIPLSAIFDYHPYGAQCTTEKPLPQLLEGQIIEIPSLEDDTVFNILEEKGKEIVIANLDRYILLQLILDQLSCFYQVQIRNGRITILNALNEEERNERWKKFYTIYEKYFQPFSK
ncbi:N-acetyltransferase [Sphingobacterium sp. LRF_L2]|uniref:N-acetyltransferase n=1 Tax=Sphingobacterium sp. LRF_L2 TaxID=3369421 RepID=UPI003F5F6EC3